MKNHTQFSDRDLQLLSAYVDEELSPREKKYVDRFLAENSFANEVVEKMKQVKAVLRQLPVRSVPRNFTITAQEHQRFQIPTLAGVLRYSTVVSALLLAIVLVLDRFSPLQLKSDQLSAGRFAENSFNEDVGMETVVPAPIITWNPSNPPAGQGLGGGGGGDEGLDMDAAQPELLAPDEISPSEEKLSDELSFSDQEFPGFESEQLPQAAEAQPRIESESSIVEQAPQSKGNGPILGVRPAEEQGKIQPGGVVPSVQDAGVQPVSLRMAEVVLAGLMVISAILSYFFSKIRK